MSKYVKITLRNPLDESQTHDLKIIPKNAKIADKWIEKLKFCLNNKLDIEKNFCWVGWPDSPRNLKYLCNQLMKYIKVINDYNDSPKCLWKEKYIITEVFTPENIVASGGRINQDLYNKLHHHFEVLQGQVWNISQWFLTADNETRYAIRQLNNICHETEILIKQLRMKRFYPENVRPSAIIAFLDGPRELLEKDDHDYFTLQRGNGRVYLGYCQIGKTHWEAFVDGDNHIGDDGISGLRYVSGEITIDFAVDSAPNQKHQESISNYGKWLKNNGLDIENKLLAHGWLHIADVDFSPYEGMTITQIQQLLSKYLDIYNISIIENDAITAQCVYDYHWNRPNFEDRQKKALFASYKTFCENAD